MPAPAMTSAAKRRGSLVRQLSLQGSATQSSAGRKGLRKQLSEESSRTRGAEPVQVTGQAWGDAGLRPSSSEGRAVTSAGKSTTRPRPVKLAWADRRQDSQESATGVEVVARRCQGQPRPVTAKPQRLTNLPLLGDKDTLVYTRQQLAERLRRAWKEREKNKPNLDIYLSHNSASAGSGLTDEPPASQLAVSARSDSSCPSPSGRRSCSTEPVRAISIEPSAKQPQPNYQTTPKTEPKCPVRPVEQKQITKQSVSVRARHLQEQNTQQNEQPQEDFIGQITNKNPALADLLDFKTFPVVNASKKFGSDFSNSKFQMKKIDITKRSSPAEQPLVVRHLRGKENMGNLSESPRSDSSYSECSKIGKLDESLKKEEMPLTASARRASFRSSNNLNKTITGSFSSSMVSSSLDFEEDTGAGPRNEIRVVLTKTNNRPPMARTLSAPTQQQPPQPAPPTQPAPVPTPAVKPYKVPVQKRPPQPSISMDIPGPNDDEDDVLAMRDRIKSAPIRRKLKTAAARRKNKDKGTDSSDDEKEVKETPTKKSTRRRQIVKNAGDIVTMVSLVSPAASDTEESVIHVSSEAWTTEDKEGTPPPSTVDEPPRDSTSFIIQKFVSLRKTTKTVSFQQQPPANKGYSASFPSRRVPAGAPIIIPAPVILNPALTPAQLQERRSTTNSNVSDTRGVKRRLVRTRSVPVKDDDASSDDNSKTDTSTEPVVEAHRNTHARQEDQKNRDDNENEEDEEDVHKEPEFKSAKEKECWVLYRKMLEKGVSVSYDTVLRGMLTPTEYRLRKNHLLSSC